MPAGLSERLAAAHGCRDGCAACGRADREALPRTLSERFGPMLEGPLALRIAGAFVDWKLPFPRFSADPLEQWLVEEALMSRWADEVRRAADAVAARSSASAEADELLARELARRRSEAEQGG